MSTAIAILGVGLLLLLLRPRWWLLALLSVTYAYLFKWPAVADDADDLIFYMPPMIAWFTVPVFVFTGSAVVALRKWLIARRRTAS